MRKSTVNAETYAPPNEIRDLATKRMVRVDLKTKERYDKSRYNNVKFNIVDIVYVKQGKVATGDSTKLQPRFKGP